MSWYKTGSVALTNGDAAVMGVGTDFVANVRIGSIFLAPDERVYEVAVVVSATELQLSRAYLGATVNGAAYAIVPTQSYIADLASQAASLLNQFSSLRDGINDGTQLVTTVAGRTGEVTLTTDDVAEGGSLYYTDARAGAKAAALMKIFGLGDKSLSTADASVNLGTDFNAMTGAISGTFTLTGNYTNGPLGAGSTTYTGILRLERRAFDAGFAVLQEVFTNGAWYWRWCNVASGTFGNWETVPTTGYITTNTMPYRGVLPAAAHDLNGYTDHGMWTQGSSSAAGSATNYPIATSGWLLVYSTDSTATNVVQVYHSVNQNRRFARTLISGTWTAWKEDATLDSPAFTGAPTVPTPASSDSSMRIANTAHVAGKTGTKGAINFRNRIINGDMRIDQRFGGAAFTPTSPLYTIDRWFANVSVASKLTFQTVPDAPPGFVSSMKVTVASKYAPAAGDAFNLQYRIEGRDMVDFCWGASGALEVTLSHYIKGSVPGTYAVSIGNTDATRSIIGLMTVTTAWAPIKITFPGDTAGTWLTDSGIGLALRFDLGSGTSFENAMANQWLAGNYHRTSACIKFVNQVVGSTLQITGAQLEAGSEATPFERRPHALEMALCQRYFHSVRGGVGARAYQLSGSSIYINSKFPVTMRAVPTITLVGTWTVANCGQPYVASTTTADSAMLVASTTATGDIACYSTSAAGYDASAEL